MNIENRKSSRRNGHALVRTVFGLGTVTAGVLAYLLSDVSRLEAIVLSAIVMGLVLFGVAVYRRARNRQEWSAAWDAYADRDVSGDPFDASVNQGMLSWTGTN
jgi:hypothetical protein